MIRLAGDRDVHQVLAMAEALVKESTLADKGWSPDKVKDLLYRLIDHPRGIIVIDDLDRGAMVGAVVEQTFSNALYAFDYGLFVWPEFRGWMIGVRLIRAFEKRARDLGAEEIWPGVMSGITPERTTRLYERLGYNRGGSQLVKRWQ